MKRKNQIEEEFLRLQYCMMNERYINYVFSEWNEYLILVFLEDRTLEKLIRYFEKREEYEKCANILNVLYGWKKLYPNPKALWYKYEDLTKLLINH